MNKNNRMTNGGYTPSQWVIGRTPRTPGSLLDEEEFADLGVLELQNDPETLFARKAKMRYASMEAFVKQDCSKRIRAALLQKAAPIPARYQQGDLVCYLRQQESQLHRTDHWSTVARVIGFEGKVVWVLHLSLIHI